MELTLFCCSNRASTSVWAVFIISSMNAVISSIFCGSSQNSAIRTFNGMWFGLDKSKLIARIRRWVSDSSGLMSKSNMVLRKYHFQVQSHLWTNKLLTFSLASYSLHWIISKMCEIMSFYGNGWMKILVKWFTFIESTSFPTRMRLCV